MSKKSTRIELNKAYVREVLLKGGPTQSICKELADGIASRYGESAEVNLYVGKNRCNASVSADSNNNDLLRAMGGE